MATSALAVVMIWPPDRLYALDGEEGLGVDADGHHVQALRVDAVVLMMSPRTTRTR